MKTAAMQVDLIDHMGSDLTVVNAARVSFDKESDWEQHPCTKEWCNHSKEVLNRLNMLDVIEEGRQTYERRLSERDAKLIDYLARHNHWTPFSHPQLQFRIKAPIFVARQWFKHMIGITRNETSRRYVDDEPEFFRMIWRLRTESVKQGSAGEAPSEIQAAANAIFDHVMATSLKGYEDLLALNIAPEQARVVLPQNMMTEWIETSSLSAACRACGLRLDPHAQQETREIAEGIAEQVAQLFPVSWAALMAT